MSTRVSPSVLGNTAVTPSTYGGTTQIPVITVDQQGRITYAANVAALSSLAGTSGSATPSLGSITFTSNYGVTITGTSNTLNIATPQNLQTTAIPQFYNLTLTTALPVSSGGTGVTTSTGSGNNVLSISPSLVTPNVGTPSYANLVNAVSYGGAITASQILGALAYTPYSATNPSGYISLAQAYANTVVVANATNSITPAGGTLNITGNVLATGTLFSSSDIAFKSNIETIVGGLDKTLALRGVTYTRIETGEKLLGLIANEVEPIIPEVIATDENGFKSVSYGNIVGLLIEAIKELKKEIDILKGNK
jgi:hypothetical protein